MFSTKSFTAADVGIVVSLSFDEIPSDSVTSVPAAIFAVVAETVNVKSYRSPSVPLSVSVSYTHLTLPTNREV